MFVKDTQKIVRHDFRKFYRKATRDNIPKRLQDFENDRIIRLFLNKVSDRIATNKAGVHIKRIGYFYVHMIPFKFYTITTNLPYKYQLAFIPTDKSIFKFWGMDFQFSSPLQKKVQAMYKKGHRWLNMIQGVTKIDHFYLGAHNATKRQCKRINRYKKTENVI